jgi:O-antigen ligase
MTAPISESDRLLRPLCAVGASWLIALPMLRPWLWQGDATNQANLIYLVLLAAATATGLVYRAVSSERLHDVRPWWARSWPWLGVFLLLALTGAWWSALPAKSYALVVGWFFHLAAPLVLFPLIYRWPQLVVAGLIAGCAGELVLMMGQALWERPVLQQSFLSDPTLSAEKRFADQFQVRVEHWRLEGSFLLANTLATYLLAMIPLIIGALVQRWNNERRNRISVWAGGLFAVASVIGFAFTGSKAAFLAALITIIMAVFMMVRSRWLRWGIIAVLGLSALGAWCIPAVSKSVQASALVRTQYWDAAWTLMQEQPISGYGWYGFEQHYPRVKSPAAEETVVVHNELLEVAVSLGIPAALFIVLWWVIAVRSLWPRASQVERALIPDAALPVRSALIGTAGLLLFTFFISDVLRPSFSLYAGGLPSVWAIAFGAGALMMARWVMTWPLPSSVWWWGSVMAVSVHALADFSLQSMQVAGPLAWLCCVAVARLGYVRVQTITAENSGRSIILAFAGMGLLAAILVGVLMTSPRTQLRERAQDALSALQRLQLSIQRPLSQEQNEQLMEQLEHHAARIVVEDGPAAMGEDPSEAIVHGYVRRLIAASTEFPRDNDLSFLALNFAHHGQLLYPAKLEAFTPYFEQLVREWPQQLSCLQALSDHYLRRAEQLTGTARHTMARQAQALCEQVVRAYPTHLPLRRQVIRAAKLTGDEATVQREENAIAQLRDKVHPDNR